MTLNSPEQPSVKSDLTFTVFTPTYNRASTLSRVYESLRAQTFRDFEWLIVDDGSTDGTSDLVRRWIVEADFPIRYLRQENRGKHIACNRAVAEARGELFLVLDSDDACVPEALERFHHHWLSIPLQERARFSAVTALCVDQHGRLIGTAFPQEFIDSDSLEIRYRHKVRGEKWGFHRTDVLRRFPFPEVVGLTHVPEGIVWNRISREYRTRFINEPLRVYWIEDGSLALGRPPAEQAAAGLLQHLNALETELDWFSWAPFEFLRFAVHFSRFSFHLGLGLRDQWMRLHHRLARALWILAVPVGYLVYGRDRWRARQG